IQRMQNELRGTLVEDEHTPGANRELIQQPGQQQQEQQQSNQPNNATPNPAGTAPPAANTGSSAVAPASPLAAPALSSQIGTGSGAIASTDLASSAANQSLRQRLNVPAAVEQSTQYAELQKRLDAFNRAHPNLTDAEAQRQFQQQQQAVASANAANKPGGASGTGTSSAAPSSAAPAAGGGLVGTPDYAKQSREAVERATQGKSQ